MNKSKFIISIKEAEELLKKIGLFKSKGPKGNGIYSKEYLTISKKKIISLKPMDVRSRIKTMIFFC
jgi:hypothetical protein